MKTAVFFDIDNTLWDFHNRIPDSTKAAIRALREKGSLAFLCSGRARGYIRDPALLNIGFDGIVSGCGTLLEYQGETLFYHRVPAEIGLRSVETARRYGFHSILEGRDFLYMDFAEFAADPYGEKLRKDLGERLKSLYDEWGAWEFSKFSCATGGCDQAAGLAALADDFDAIVHNEYVVELVPRGFSKGEGIRRICGMIGIDLADTVAFGDSANDLSMFEVCGTSVCMGNGSETAKRAADMVTNSLEEDGIWNACKALSLI